MKHCDTCTCAQPFLLNTTQLLEMMKTGTSDHPRDVYRAAKTDRWFVTYSGGETTREAVEALLGCGAIRSKHGTPDYFCLTEEPQ